MCVRLDIGLLRVTENGDIAVYNKFKITATREKKAYGTNK